MKVLKKRRNVTELYFNEYDSTVEIYTYNAKLKKLLSEYAATYPELCRLTEDNGESGLRFEIDKHRVSIRLTAPYSQNRKAAASQQAAQTGIHIKIRYAISKHTPWITKMIQGGLKLAYWMHRSCKGSLYYTENASMVIVVLPKVQSSPPLPLAPHESRKPKAFANSLTYSSVKLSLGRKILPRLLLLIIVFCWVQRFL